MQLYVAESLDISAYALKRLLNHKDSRDVTAGYIVPTAERLREPMEKISKFLLSACQEQAGPAVVHMSAHQQYADAEYQIAGGR